MFEDQQEGNYSVVSVKVFAEVIVGAHLAGEDRILFSHAILYEGVAALGNDRLGSVLLTHLCRRPDDPRIEDYLIVAAVFDQQNVGE